MKKVRILLRVSSDQQLEADGDLSVQRKLVTEYIEKHEDWELDGKEYFEGSKSGYKMAVADRDVLQEALEDAKNKQYDILVAYKDDRIGRRMWEIGAYVMSLKSFGVDIYTVKDGCISPESNDIMGQMMLALRFGNAQKSSSDTGMRVRDTARKLVQRGKFMGGSAPYGYRLKLSGELSKHGRALHTLEVIPEQAEVVKYIYSLSLHQEYGSAKIARILNEDKYYKLMAPGQQRKNQAYSPGWKAGTITSILTNPVYSGHVAYRRRERKNGNYHRLDSRDWIKAVETNVNIQIIGGEMWNMVQDKRKRRADKYVKTLEHKGIPVIRRNDGMLSLVDVIHCGYCGRKLTNGTKYSYWEIKSTGEKRSSKTPIYRCQNAQSGGSHNQAAQFRADGIEKIVFDCLEEYIGRIQTNEDALEIIKQNRKAGRMAQENEIRRLQKELNKMSRDIEIMEGYIPDAMTGVCALTLDDLAVCIHREKEKMEGQERLIREKRESLKEAGISADEWESLKIQIPTWQQVFRKADMPTQRVLVNKLIERIDVTREQIVIRFRINLNNFLPQPRMSGDSPTTPYTPCSG